MLRPQLSDDASISDLFGLCHIAHSSTHMNALEEHLVRPWMAVATLRKKSSQSKVSDGYDQIVKLTDGRLLYGDVVTVEVGEGKVKHYVHEGLLRRHSEWFAARMNGKWGNTKRIELPDDDSEIFAIFVEVMYHNELPMPTPSQQSDSLDEYIGRQRKFAERNLRPHILAKLYIFADMRQCLRLRCLAIDAFRRWLKETGEVPSETRQTSSTRTLL